MAIITNDKTYREAQTVEIPSELTEEQRKLAGALSDKELSFANLWLTRDAHGLNRTNCYKASGYTAKNDNVAAVCSGRLLKKTKIWEYCQAMRNESVKDTGLSLRYLDQQLKELIDGTAVEIMPVIEHTRTNPLTGQSETYLAPALVCATEDLPDAVQASIQSIKMGPNGPEVKTYSRVDVLKLAYQRQGALREGREISGPGGSPLEAPVFSYRIVGGPGTEPPLEKDEDGGS